MSYKSKLSLDNKTHSYIRVEKEDENYYYGIVIIYYKGKFSKIVVNGSIDKNNCHKLNKDEFNDIIETSIFSLEKYIEK